MTGTRIILNILSTPITTFTRKWQMEFNSITFVRVHSTRCHCVLSYHVSVWSGIVQRMTQFEYKTKYDTRRVCVCVLVSSSVSRLHWTRVHTLSIGEYAVCYTSHACSLEIFAHWVDVDLKCCKLYLSFCFSVERACMRMDINDWVPLMWCETSNSRIEPNMKEKKNRKC